MTAIFFGLMAGMATLGGMWLVLTHEAWARRNSVYLIAFAVGVLLTTSLTEIIPEALELSPHVFLVVLGTFFAFYVLEHSVVAHHHHLHSESVHRDPPVEKIAFLGLAIHSLIDGLAIGAGFEVSTAFGVIATIAVILHEVPEGITTLSLFLHTGYPRQRAMRYTSIVALATPLGAIATTLVPQLLTESTLGILLAIAGGSFLYIASANLIPETHKAKHVPAIILMGLGLAVPFAVDALLPHERGVDAPVQEEAPSVVGATAKLEEWRD